MIFRSFFLCVWGFLVSGPLFSQEILSVRELVFKGLYQRSPFGRYEARDFSPGVKGFGLSDRCLEEDLRSFFQLQEPPTKVILPEQNKTYTDKDPNIRTRDLSLIIKDFEAVLREELQVQISLFEDDPVIKNREVCVDAVEFDHPNAVSVGLGYLLFDPQLFFQILRSEASNEWSLRAILSHEFAHQLQIWTSDASLFRTKNEVRFVRDKELQADCVASAILYRQSSVDPKAVVDKTTPIANALISAFVSLGDFEIHHYEGHHGTAYERSLMVSVGIDSLRDIERRKEAFTSEGILSACLEYIDGMNQKYGDELWPMGSRLD